MIFLVIMEGKFHAILFYDIYLLVSAGRNPIRCFSLLALLSGSLFDITQLVSIFCWRHPSHFMNAHLLCDFLILPFGHMRGCDRCGLIYAFLTDLSLLLIVHRYRSWTIHG